MRFYVGKLLSVNVDDAGKYNSLVFESKKFDFGLQREVECSELVGISKECLQFLDNYKSNVGSTIIVGVSNLITKNNAIFTIVTTDVLELADLYETT